jgi:hypothetical protein
MDNTYISNRDMNPQEIALAYLAGAGAIEGGRFAKHGYYGIDAADFVKNPLYWSRMIINPDSFIPKNPMLKGSVIASEDITRNSLIPNRQLIQPQNAVLDDVLPDFKFNEEWMDPETGQITRASDYADTGYVPKIKEERIIARKGGIVPAQPFRDAVNYLQGNILKFTNNKGLPFGNKIRTISEADMSVAVQDLLDTAGYNYNDVAMARIIKDRKSKGNRFDTNANKEMYNKIAKKYNIRPESFADLVDVSVRTKLPLDNIVNAFAQLSGGTNHMGAMNALEEAINLYQTGGFLPEYELTQAERIIGELPQNRRVQYAVGLLDGKYTPQGAKTNRLISIIRDLVGLPGGQDAIVFDNRDIKKATNTGEYRTDTISNHFFDNPKAYNALTDAVQEHIIKSPAFNALVKMAGGKKLSGIQSILRGYL